MNQQNLISSLAPLYLFLCGLAGSVDSQVLGLVSDQSGPRAQEPSSCCPEVQPPKGGRRDLSFLNSVGRT